MSWFIEAFLYSCLCFFVPAVMTRLIFKNMRRLGCGGFSFFILVFSLITLRVALTTLSFLGKGILAFWAIWIVIDVFICSL